ncbi:hypothetical protein FRC02_001144 [Tulasnella sp. 418]|nr:hypothetical protein FRC02_001144 [Tulasnella sp. 418]
MNTPSWRRRNRALSHPQVTDLCKEWLHRGPANVTKSIDNEPDLISITMSRDDSSDLQLSLQP